MLSWTERYLELSKFAMDISKETCITGGWQYLEMSKATNAELEAFKDRYCAFIRRRMAELGLTKADLTRQGPFEQTFMTRLLEGKDGVRPVPSIENAIKLARVLQTDLQSMFEGKKHFQLGVTVDGAARGGVMQKEVTINRKSVSVPLELFSEDVVRVLVDDKALEPDYHSGDVLLGPKTEGCRAHNLIGRHCIIATGDGQVLIARLDRSKARGKFTATFVGDRRRGETVEVKVEWAAPIQAILRNDG